MHKKITKIESTMLGFQDHGIFTATLFMDYGGSGQGVGGYVMGTHSGFITRVLKACGVDKWEALKGRTVFVLTEDESWNARVIGIAPLPTEIGEQFLFADWQAEVNAVKR